MIKPQFLFKTIKNVQNLYPYFKKLDIDVILGGSSGMNTLPLIILLSMIFDVKVASIAYGNDFLVRSGLSFKSYYLNNLDLIFLGTNKMKKVIQKIHSILDPNKFEVINYGLILDEYKIKESKAELREKFGIFMDDVILLSVGRHVSRKNFDLVIKAIKKVKENHEKLKIKYFLLGEGEATPMLKDLSKKLGLEKDVKFLGYVDTLTRNYYYKLSDIFIMPSKIEKESIEGFGIVFLEANFFNLPVIGTKSGGITEAIIDGTTGFLIKPNNIDDLVNKIEYLYLNPEKRLDMGNKGHNRVISKFDWNSIVKDYINCLNNLFESK
jgi:glycosyltransferase involved in cell wall biosynthesis